MRQVGSEVRRGRFDSEAMPEVALTLAEVRILELLPTHLTLAQIAGELFISRNTAKCHVAAIYRKLSVGSRDEAVCRARETRLLPAQTDAHAEPTRGDDRARVLAFPRPAAPEGAERDPEAPVTRRHHPPSEQIPRPPAQRDPLITTGAGAATPDRDMVAARSWAARKQAREICARASQAQQMSLTLQTALTIRPCSDDV